MKRQNPCLGFQSSSEKEPTVIRLVVQQDEEEETLTLSRGVRGSKHWQDGLQNVGDGEGGLKTSRY